MIQDLFGDAIKLIANQDNPGFSKANNQGIAIAQGEYVLLLNPDTLVDESTFTTCIGCMEENKQIGALGVYMIDGTGNFLAESKRALPTPWVSFYKIFGLASLFPRSKKFGQYHLSFLSNREDHKVDVLSGAFMFMRKSALDKVGDLDETFFMYGEDIDLSYRFILSGYQNYYLAQTRILHYKGESTKKGSLNYVRVFYQAMIIFAEKHFQQSLKYWFTLAIRIAVYLRAIIAVVTRVINRMGFPLLEGVLIYLTIFGIKSYWEHYVKYIEGQGGHYPLVFQEVYMPIYACIFVLFLWLGGAYRRPFRLKPLFTAPFWAFMTIATITYFFSFIQNFSRAIVGLSALFTVFTTFTLRGFINWRTQRRFFFTEIHRPKALLIGHSAHLASHWQWIQQQLNFPAELIGFITIDDQVPNDLPNEHLGRLPDLEALVVMYQVEELVFCHKDFPTATLFDLMEKLANRKLRFKILPPDSNYLIGPNKVYVSGQGSDVESPLSRPGIKRQKRWIDRLISTFMLLLFPILFPFFTNPIQAIKKLGLIWVGSHHFVGYIQPDSPQLPSLKPAPINISLRWRGSNKLSSQQQSHLDRFYASHYSWELDIELILKGWRKIS